MPFYGNSALLDEEDQYPGAALTQPTEQPRATPQVDSMARWRQMLQASGLMPADRQVYAPTAADEAEIERRRRYTLMQNVGNSLQGKETQDPFAVRQSYLDERQKPLDTQFAVQSAKADALRSASKEDIGQYLFYTADDKTGKPMPFDEWMSTKSARYGGGGMSDFQTKAEMFR
jgi:hypothetical protein